MDVIVFLFRITQFHVFPFNLINRPSIRGMWVELPTKWTRLLRNVIFEACYSALSDRHYSCSLSDQLDLKIHCK